MNARGVTILIGLVLTGFGLAGLLDPHRTMSFAGLASLKPTQPAGALGEIRAVYGGQLVVMGLWTILVGLQLRRLRSFLLYFGLLWLGVCGGRLLGVYLDGDPGLMPGWLAVGIEATLGLVFLGAWWGARPRSQPKPSAAAHTEMPPPVETAAQP